MQQVLTPLQVEKPSKKINLNLEALRGIAAIIVVWHHFITHKYWLDPHYIPTCIFIFSPPGHFSVLIFFVLSGYLIGINHLQPLKKSDILLYLKKRFVRIYPIYFLSMVAAILVARHTYSASVILSNLALTQNFLSPTIFENNPAWSLNYEILFYLLFVPLSFFRVNVPIVTLGAATLGSIAYFQGHGRASTYVLGFTFWLAGLILAKYFQRPAKVSFATMVSMVFLLIALEKFNFLGILIEQGIVVFGLGQHIPETIIKFVDFSYLPYSVMMVLLFASKHFAFSKYIVPLLLLIPACTFYYIVQTPAALHDPTLVIPAICYILAVAIYFARGPVEQVCGSLIDRLAATGTISYGLYIIHFPIIVLFARVTWFSGNVWTFGIRLALYLVLCASAAYWLERKFQPAVKRYIG